MYLGTINHGKNIQHLAVYQQWNTPQRYKFIDDFTKTLQNQQKQIKRILIEEIMANISNIWTYMEYSTMQ